MEILIAGIGAIGGYYGGKLAHHYHHNPNVRVSFLGRGENLNAIRKHSLQLQTTSGNFVAEPYRISDQAGDLPVPDFILLAVKSYSLEEVALHLKNSVGKETIIISLLNGIDPVERLKKIFTHQQVAYGCVYAISVLQEPGLITQSGTVDQIYFGIPEKTDERLVQFESVLQQAGVNAILTFDILQEIWKKFSFLSPVAAVTTYTNSSLGEIRENPEKLNLLKSLMNELLSLSRMKSISLPEDIIERNLNIISAQPHESTSSMHRDAQQHHRTELETLIGYVVREAEVLHLDVPVYRKLYGELKSSLRA
jgi:2-dehydropantoate 2-reductase